MLFQSKSFGTLLEKLEKNENKANFLILHKIFYLPWELSEQLMCATSFIFIWEKMPSKSQPILTTL